MPRPPRFLHRAGPLAVIVLLAGCGQPAPPPQATPGVLITTSPLGHTPLEVLERSVGRLESRSSPLVAAEVAGQVREVRVEVGHAVDAGAVLAVVDARDHELRQAAAQAEIGRLEAQAAQQQRLLARYERLASGDFFAANSLEEAQAQLKVLNRQLEAARTALGEARLALSRTQVRAPVAGRVETRTVDPGDYVKAGAGMFRLSTDRMLRAVLPFPERLATTLATGQTVRLSVPTAPDVRVEARITELRPTVGSGNRAVEALVDFANPGAWRAGASVDGEVVIQRRDNAIVIPEGAVVLRPAGAVVYVVQGNTVRAQPVRTGHQDGRQVEIVEGLEGTETIALDGAGFLTDGATVRLAEDQP